MIVYAICLVVGLTFTVISVLAGEFFGHFGHVAGSGGHVEAGADSSDAPGMSIFSPTILASFITSFGGFGLIFSQFDATKSAIISAPLSLVGGAVVAGALLCFFRFLFQHSQGSSESHVARLIGMEANVITPIPQNGVGEIAYVDGDSRYTAPARGENGVAVSNGQSVKITRIVGTQCYVTITK